MNKKILSILLVSLTGTAIFITSPATAQGKAPSSQAQPSSKGAATGSLQNKPLWNRAPDLQQFAQDAQALKKDYDNTLTALNKEKGYDPEIYKLIYQAGMDLSKITDSLNMLSKNAKTIDEAAADIAKTLDNMKFQIKAIEKMKPKVPKTFPGKCKDYREHSVKGVIDTLAGKWTFKTFTNNKVEYHQFSPDVGWTDGNPAIISRTIKGKTDTAYLEGNTVVCLDPFK